MPNIFKTKSKEEVPKLQTQQSTPVHKSQAYLPVPEPVSGPKPWSVTHCDARPVSVSPVPFSPSPIQSYPVTDSREEVRPQSQASLAESLVFQGNAPEITENDGAENHADPEKHEDGGVKSYITKILKLGPEDPEGRGEKGHNRHSFKLSETKMQAYLSTLMRSKEKGMPGKERPMSRVSIAESVMSKGSSARTYISNMLNSKTDVPERDREIDTRKPEEEITDIEKTKTIKFKTYIGSKGSSAKSSISNIMQSKSKIEDIPDSQQDGDDSATSRLSKTFKLKKDSVANFVSNMSNKKTKDNNDQTYTTKSVATELPKSKRSSLHSFVKQHVKTPSKIGDTVTLLKEKSASSKKYIEDKLKKSEDKESSTSKTEDKGFQSQEIPITEGHLPKMTKYTESTSQAESLKNTPPESTFNMKHEMRNSNSFINSVEHTLDDSDTITSSSVREYVQRYEAKHMSNTTPNNLHSRPFNYFTGNVLSSSTHSSGTAEYSEGWKVTGNVARDRVSFVTQKSADTVIRTGNETSHTMKHTEEKEKRSWDIRVDFSRFSDNMARRKKAGAEKVEQSWTGVKTRARRTKLVRALQRKKAVPEEDDEGKFFLQTGSGRKGQLYTFRKSPM